jgi:hypothetical protein
MKRQYLIYAAVALVLLAAYFSRERFGPSKDINMELDPAPYGVMEETVTCGDQTRAKEGQCSLDSMNSGAHLMPY